MRRGTLSTVMLLGADLVGVAAEIQRRGRRREEANLSFVSGS